MIHESVVTEFCSAAFEPQIDTSAFVHPLAAVIGHVTVGRRVMVAPFASLRGDEGHPIFVGDESNVQDQVVLHALETEKDGRPVAANQVEAGGRKYGVYVGHRVSLAHQSQVHGPAYVGDGTFVGMQTLIFDARVGRDCVIEPKCLVMGVTIPAGRYVPAGTILKVQAAAEALPTIDHTYDRRHINRSVVHVNVRLAEGYAKANLPARGR